MRPLLCSLLLLFALVLSGCRESTRTSEQYDVLLLLVDTLRADHLGLYGYSRPTSPQLDRFAASSTVFLDVVAPAPWTLPSVGSVMTSTYASVHGLRAAQGRRGMVSLRPGSKTLAESLASRGYRTIGLVTNPWVSARKGLQRGFDEYEALRGGADDLHRAAREKLVRDTDPRPIFLYIHYMDVHGPYNRFRQERADLGPVPERYAREIEPEELERIPRYLRRDTTRLESHIEAYDRGIRGWDAAFGEFVSWLSDSGRLERTIVAVLSDHGEEFLERGGWNHGITLYQEQLWVPWVLRIPGSPSREVHETVSLIDVAPTILGLVGAPIPASMKGRDLLGRRSAAEPRTIFSETEVRLGAIADASAEQVAMRRGHIKLVRTTEADTCFDLRTDPDEKRPIQPTRSSEPGEGRDCDPRDFRLLESWREHARQTGRALGEGSVHEFTAAEREHLRALGYAE